MLHGLSGKALTSLLCACLCACVHHAAVADGSSELQEAEAFKSAVLGALIQSVGLQPQRSLGRTPSGSMPPPPRHVPKVRACFARLITLSALLYRRDT